MNDLPELLAIMASHLYRKPALIEHEAAARREAIHLARLIWLDTLKIEKYGYD